MQVYILNEDFEQIAIIDQADSILWQKKYNDVGECEIYLPCDNEALSVLKDGFYVYRYDDDMLCQIKNIKLETDVEKGDYLIATAKDICTILSGRIVWDRIVYSGSVGGFLKKVLNDNVINSNQGKRNIPYLTLDEQSFNAITNEITKETQSEDILQLIISTCKAYNVGFRVSLNLNTKKLVLRLYKGKNKATMQSDNYIEFSPTFANIISSSYEEDSSNYKNYAIVGAKDVDETLMYITVSLDGNEPSGENRKEIYVDATSQSRDVSVEELLLLYPNATLSGTTYSVTISGVPISVATVNDDKVTLTDTAFERLLNVIGINALIEHQKSHSFNGNVDAIDTYEYKTDYDLGDIVNVINEYGISANALITEVMESKDNENGYEIEPRFEF